MANKDLFAQAIADAKKLKEISMANAKQAIEEAFAPRIQEMFRMKLSEMDEPTEEVMGDQMGDDYMEEEMEGGMTTGTVDEMTLEEILAELELEEGMEDGKSHMKEAKDDEEADDTDDEAEEESTGGETVAEVDLDTLVSKVADAVINALNAKEGGAENMEAGEGEKDGAISLDEILAELQEADEMEMEEGLGDMIKKAGGAIKGAVKSVGKALGGTPKECTEEAEAEVADAISKEYSKSDAYDKFYWPTINACRKRHNMSPLVSSGGPLQGGGWGEGVEMEEGLGDMMKKAGGAIKGAVKSVGYALGGSPKDCIERGNKIVAIAKARAEKENKTLSPDQYEYLKMLEVNACRKEHNLEPLVAWKGPGTLSSRDESVQLQEAVKVIKTLKSQLNEINLLNAKLLYVNKIFKAKSLTEAQKVRVVSAFDRAATIREAKNIYATLTESLQSPSSKKAPLKESLGFASKPIGSAPARPIVEADAYVHRMQQLAGLRQPNI